MTLRKLLLSDIEQNIYYRIFLSVFATFSGVNEEIRSAASISAAAVYAHEQLA